MDRLLVVPLPKVCAGIFTGSVGGEHHPDDAGSADRHEHEHALAGAEDVHHRAHDGAEHDGARHAGDLAAGDVLLGQVQRVRLHEPDQRTG